MAATWTQDPVAGFQRIGRTFRKIFRGVTFADAANTVPAHGFSTVTSENLEVVYVQNGTGGIIPSLQLDLPGTGREVFVGAGESANISHAYYTVDGY